VYDDGLAAMALVELIDTLIGGGVAAEAADAGRSPKLAAPSAIVDGHTTALRRPRGFIVRAAVRRRENAPPIMMVSDAAGCTKQTLRCIESTPISPADPARTGQRRASLLNTPRTVAPLFPATPSQNQNGLLDASVARIGLAGAADRPPSPPDARSPRQSSPPPPEGFHPQMGDETVVKRGLDGGR
jgi:hypothetical protein